METPRKSGVWQRFLGYICWPISKEYLLWLAKADLSGFSKEELLEIDNLVAGHLYIDWCSYLEYTTPKSFFTHLVLTILFLGFWPVMWILGGKRAKKILYPKILRTDKAWQAVKRQRYKIHQQENGRPIECIWCEGKMLPDDRTCPSCGRDQIKDIERSTEDLAFRVNTNRMLRGEII